jgi:hypothetical protein
MSPWCVHYSNLAPDGLEILLETEPEAPIDVMLIDQSYGLPTMPNLFVRGRPGHMMPAPGWGDSTLVRASYRF